MKNKINVFCQVAIPVLGGLAVLLVANKVKWGFVLGLASQLFWFYSAIYSRQWGVVIASVIYTVSWGLGIWAWFFN